MFTFSKMLSVVALLLVIIAAMVNSQPTADCATKLTPCSQSLNSTTPAKECCDSLSDAITNDRACLCNLYGSGVLNTFGINITEALQLPKKCGLDGDLSDCTKTNGTSTTNTTSSVPPARPSGENGAGREAMRGMFSVILLICASLMVF